MFKWIRNSWLYIATWLVCGSSVVLAQQDKNAELLKMNTMLGNAAAKPTDRQMMLSIVAAVGVLVVLAALAWLLITVVRAVFKRPYSFMKPLLLLGVGIVMWLLPKILG